MAEHPDAEPIRSAFEAFAMATWLECSRWWPRTPYGTYQVEVRWLVIIMVATQCSTCSAGWCRRRREPSLNNFTLQLPMTIMLSH